MAKFCMFTSFDIACKGHSARPLNIFRLPATRYLSLKFVPPVNFAEFAGFDALAG